MLYIETYLVKDDINRKYLSSHEELKKGQTIWQFDERTTAIFWKKQFINYCYSLEKDEIVRLINSAYIKDGIIYSQTDNSKYISHSNTPNIAMINNNLAVATQDMPKDTILTINYDLSFDINSFHNLKLNYLANKEDLISELKRHLLKPGRPKSRFLT